ncbi:MAG: FAD-dependent oxidoreductase [Phycisphaeraceae bacterium]|nr:FAD-dependent oxidoreductase [Phycisphaeraceae bacterium]
MPMLRLLALTLLCLLACIGCASSGVTEAKQGDGPVYDVVVYGGTSAGIIAAVQAKKDSLSVAIVCPDTRLGGLTANGLGWTDSGRKHVIGGLARDFYTDMYAYYQNNAVWKHQTIDEFVAIPRATRTINHTTKTLWSFEPSAAKTIYERYLAEHAIPVFRDHWLDRDNGVTMDGRRITAITMLNGKAFRGRQFIDATYEGDLMAAAGVSYTTGRESNSTYGETLNGNQPGRKTHQFTKDVDPYVVPGDPTSGLLPHIQEGGTGEPGAGDHRLQAYNFRVCLTKVPENRVPFPKPEGYDPGQYELLLRALKAHGAYVFHKFDPAPNAKTDTNNHGPFSTDNIGMNYGYPDASYERRAEIVEAHRVYQQGYFYFLSNDPRVPAQVREQMSQWGLAKDEFVESGHWPTQLYIREARRMVSDFVITENHLKLSLPTPRSVGMGSYNMDSHNTRRYVDGQGFVRNEGDVQVRLKAPYPIDYAAIVPKRGECDNLLVPICVSASHIAFGSIRMEPVFMILGQSSAQAARLAIELGVAVQDVPYGVLRERLLAAGQVLEDIAQTSGATQRAQDPPRFTTCR